VKQPIYHLSQKAREELDEKKRVLCSAVMLGIIPTQLLRGRIQEYHDHVARLYASARVEINGEEMTTAYCPDCKREHRMKDDVVRYSCVCSPHRERLVAEDYHREGMLSNRLSEREGA
jgi:hypothetical protein